MIGSKILLVDDEIVFTNNMSKLLTNLGYRVKAVKSFRSVFEVFPKDKRKK